MAIERQLGNAGLILLSRVVDLAAGLATIALVTRYLGAETFGQYAFLWAIVTMLSPVIALGVARIIVRDVAQTHAVAADLIASGLALNGVMAVWAAVIAFGIAHAVGIGDSILLAALGMALVSEVCNIMRQTTGSIFLAFEVMRYDLWVTVAARLISLGCIVTFVLCRAGFLSLFVAVAAGNVAALIIAQRVMRGKLLRPRWQAARHHIRYLFRESSQVAIYNFLGSAYIYVGVFLLKLFRDFREVSYFQAPQRVLTPLMIFPMSLLLAFTPGLSRLVADKARLPQVRALHGRLARYVLVVVGPGCVLAAFHARPIVHHLFGDEFAPAATSFAILVWSIVAFSLNAFINTVMTFMGRQGTLVVTHAVCLLVAGVASVPLVQRYGHVGASLCFVASLVLLYLVNAGVMRAYVPAGVRGGELKPVRIFGMLAGFAIVMKGTHAIMDAWLGLLIAVIVYLAGCVCLHLVSRDELQAIRQTGAAFTRSLASRYAPPC